MKADSPNPLLGAAAGRAAGAVLAAAVAAILLAPTSLAARLAAAWVAAEAAYFLLFRQRCVAMKVMGGAHHEKRGCRGGGRNGRGAPPLPG